MSLRGTSTLPKYHGPAIVVRLLTEILLFIYRSEENSEMSIIALFHSIGDHIPILKKEKFGQPDPEGIIASFHYRGTCMLIFGFTLMVTCTEWISGK